MARLRVWREQTIAGLAKAGVTLDDSRKALRHAATLQRLAEAQCNGDWPANGGGRWTTIECPRCMSSWAQSVVLERGCPDCRTSDAATAHATECGAEAIIQGDPRGAVLSWRVPAIGPGAVVVSIG
jgi:hypothetical protein